ncbi:DNA polymerase III subunit gamma/tau [Herbaspirillum sp. SJZ107]|uniref:DNA polymerase III subunit gamma/tau n=1 Tax=Herbaspirillum sp. SJZ107 TaxID=2572881 RepID=UPI00115303CF|nr:DNA polymerase III subunit gamma/tau [Herbaspirillum sp. SJZ107]TQK10694.1 DNA polymerase III gamma subunit /DNA polymerase III tau subunit [Herbaspirillum sp. SJZ107]
MSYQVLARKYRPRNFETLVGQEHVVRALTHALRTGRLHHAYLFTGTRGVGKTTLSRILAKSLNCVGPDGQGGITAEPCGQCEPCRAIDAGRFVDYVEMDAASNRGVDEMAQLLEQAVYAPSNARFKVYMIDEVHMLTNHAFNAMLKTLEEPPEHVKFILATTDPQKIPVTVLSRCLQFNLKQMPPGHIVGHLENILGQEGVSFEQPALRLLAQGAHGSMRDALSLTDQAIAYAAGAVTLDAVQGMLGALDQSYLIRLLDALANQDGADLMAVADEMASRSLSYNGALQDLGTLLHRIALAQTVPAALPDDLPELADIGRLATLFDPQEVQLFYQIAVVGRNEIGLAPDEYAGFTMTLLRMLAFRPGQGGAEQVAAPAPAALARAMPAGGAANGGAGRAAAAAAAAAAQPAPGRPAAPPAAAAHAPAAQPAPTPAPAGAAPAMTSARAAINAALEAARAAARSPGQPKRTPAGPPDASGAAAAAAQPAAPPPAAPPAPAAPARPAAAAASAPWDNAPGAGARPQPDSRAAENRPMQPQAMGRAPQPQSQHQGQPQAQSPGGAQAYARGGEQAVADDDVPSWVTEFSDDSAVAAAAPAEAPAAVSPPVRNPVPARAPHAYVVTPVPAIGWDGNWPALAAGLQLRGVSQQLALQTELIECVAEAGSATFRLRVPVDTLRASGNSEKLCAALQECFPAVRVNLDTEIGPVWYTASAEAKARRERLQQEAEAAVEADPFVQDMARTFDAFVVPGSVRPIAT